MSVAYYGDFAEDDTVNLPFNTFSSNDPSASVTATDLVDADIFVHKDGSATAITTDGATIDIDAPGVGAHMITIDTSVHADYATGSEYSVRINGVTVDSGTINAWIGSFSIERAGGVLALLKGTNSLSDIEGKIDTVQTDLDNATDGLGALKTLIDALNDLSAANILTEVNTALDATISELAVATPTATPSLRTAAMLLYMAVLNKRDTTASSDEIHNNAGTKIADADVLDDGVTFTKAKYT